MFVDQGNLVSKTAQDLAREFVGVERYCFSGMSGRGCERWEANFGCFIAAAFGALGARSANLAHEVNIRWNEGAVRNFAGGEVEAEFRVGGMTSADVEFDAFEDSGSLGSADVWCRSQE